ncbi:endo alpha-1,4 polygalactosaminidase [Streptomyces sp. NPDC087856]|uniref:endo alpha-1,4 polygalactosaminidase n=1 Tax=Streptomyces sp. NPDC087856 TaxID=3365811 RepID=UPI0038136749
MHIPRRTGPKLFAAATALVAGTVGAILTVGTAGAATSTLTPTSLTTTAGTTGGQDVSTLATQDLSGTTDNSDNYVELQGHTASTAYAGYLTYTVPSSITPSSVNGLQLKVNYRGPATAQQTWTWSVYDWNTSSWVTLGTNAGAPAWGNWKVLTFTAGGTLPHEIQAGTGAVRIRITSNNAADDADLDYAGLNVSSTAATPSATGTPTSSAPTAVWKPAKTTRLQYQLQPSSTGSSAAGGIQVGICAVPYTGGSCVKPGAYGIDLYGPDGTTPNAAAVQSIHASGAKAICYVDGGTWEQWRPDAAAFPASLLGNGVAGGPDGQPWPGEKWFDIRNTSVLLPLIDARVAKCQNAGFDAVEFDNVDSYRNNPGFPVTAANQLTYNKGLAGLAHNHNLSVALKNDLDQVPDLVGSFDFAINESCQEYNECNTLAPFLNAGKAVFQIEYSDDGSSAGGTCPAANSAGRAAIIKTLDLNATPWTPCQ